MAASIRQRMQADLLLAMKAHDREATAVLRTTLAAVANAEGVDTSGPVTAAGLLGDVMRRELSETDVVAIVRAELVELEQMISQLLRLGRRSPAEGLCARADVLRGYLADH